MPGRSQSIKRKFTRVSMEVQNVHARRPLLFSNAGKIIVGGASETVRKFTVYKAEVHSCGRWKFRTFVPVDHSSWYVAKFTCAFRQVHVCRLRSSLANFHEFTCTEVQMPYHGSSLVQTEKFTS